VCIFFIHNYDTFIGAFYFAVGNIILSPKYRSQISAIHLVALVKSTYIGTYGMDSVLKPIVEDVKKLVRINVYSKKLINYKMQSATLLTSKDHKEFDLFYTYQQYYVMLF